ncbi:MAG: ankyrin repeat domain-containing protein, partial [Spirochaetales bacterium]|nr:ankyrin repeat domain-containing protein [Spirochaetales bacterium]
GYTPLKATLFPMRAYVRDATYIVKFLLDAEADFKSDSWDSQTLEPILMQAAWEGFTGVVETLLEAGVSANAHNEIGHSALMSAVGGRSPAEIVRKLLEAGADANAENINGRTALHWALTPIYGEIDPEVISLLIEAGADVNAVDSDKRTPLKIAQDKNDPQIVTILRDSGAR